MFCTSRRGEAEHAGLQGQLINACHEDTRYGDIDFAFRFIDVLVVAPVMTDLDAAGGRDLDGDDYEQVPKGNLDVTGRYFLWTTNLGGGRLDAFLVKIPAERLGPLPARATSDTRPGRAAARR